MRFPYKFFFVFLSVLVIFRSRSRSLGSRRRIIYGWGINYYYFHSCFFYIWFIKAFIDLIFCFSVIEICIFFSFLLFGGVLLIFSENFSWILRSAWNITINISIVISRRHYRSSKRGKIVGYSFSWSIEVWWPIIIEIARGRCYLGSFILWKYFL
jgi:hypothetical protein